MKRHNPFVVLEGASGVGKSTAARLLADSLGGVLYATPPWPFSEIRGYLDQEFADAAATPARFLFYLASVAYASREIERLIATVPVVGDRYLPTTLAYHRVMGYRPDLSGLQLDLVLPDAVVVLTCDEDIRTGRINARGWSPNDVLEETFRLSKAFEQELVSAALELVGSAYVIDTSALSAEEVAGEVARSLGLVQCPTANPSGGGARLAHLAEAASAKLYSGPGGVARRPGPLIPSAITVGRKEYR